MASSGSAPWGGILSRGCTRRTAWIRRLSSGLPGTTAGPDFPPWRTRSRESRRRPPSSVSVWQVKQLRASTGRMRVSKNSVESAACGAAPRWTIPQSASVRAAAADLGMPRVHAEPAHDPAARTLLARRALDLHAEARHDGALRATLGAVERHGRRQEERRQLARARREQRAEALDPVRPEDDARLGRLLHRPRLPRLLDRLWPAATQLHDLCPMYLTDAGEGDHVGLALAPPCQGGRPLAATVERVHLLTGLDHAAVHQARHQG